jgi:hypothetical protein
MMIDVGKYVGIPWVCSSVRPPSFSGADCYGLVRLFYREEFGVDVPDAGAVAGDVGSVHEAYLSVRCRWRLVDKPVPWCAVAMRRNMRVPDLVTHFGIYVPGTIARVLHAPEEVTGSTLVRLSAVQQSVAGFYVWPE